MNSLFVFSFITVILECAVSEQRDNKWTRLTVLDGFLSSPGTVMSANSRVHCGRTCICTNGCQSFFFIDGEEESNCQLHDEVLSTSLGMIPNLNASYYFSVSVSYPPFPNDELYHTTLLSDNSLFTFKFHNQKLIYSKAVETCVSENGRLVRITTATKMDMLRTVLENPDYAVPRIYVDGFYETGVWYFNNYDVATFPVNFWAPGEPIGASSFSCTRLVSQTLWYAENWDCFDLDLDSDSFICEK